MFEINGVTYRYRANWRGKLILQVRVHWTGYNSYGECFPCSAWKDATVGQLPISILSTS